MKKHYLNKDILNSTNAICILLIGVGGTGSHMLSCLASINETLVQLDRNPLHVIACDYDKVERHNIGRQLFYEQDIGENKADVLISRINRTYGYDWNAYMTKADDKFFDNFPFIDIVITCTDNVESRLLVKKNRKDYHYWLDIGNSRDSGQFILSEFPNKDKRKKRLKDLFDMYEVKEDVTEPSCSMIESLDNQNLFINRTLACMASTLLWELLYNYFITYQGGFINTETGQLSYIKIK